MKRIFLVCCAAVVLSGCAPTQQVSLTPSVTIRTEKISEEGKGYSIAAEYPVIGGMDEARANRVNEAIRSLVDADIAAFKEFPQVDRTRFPEVPAYELRLSFDPHLVNTSLASIVFFSYRYTAGAHGATEAIPFNYDIVATRPLGLDELFVDSSNYLDQLSAASIAELTVRYPDVEKREIENGASPSADHFAAFALTQDSLVIFFQEYQVGPYVIGMPRVSIPLRRLEKIIDTASAARLLLTTNAS